ncbi:Crp/Fnr family transcriptional regulator [Pseudorhodoferax sp.]|uniref:Crp/Fnr family transcriptional regulator n=1 Tax=Pseudorhodoferax sp. TaxID=1993553 RepID=UPI002DD6314D|nr:Crp/Fnr family transcriptional regulator [Pseudorhodoferax sp.]
MLWQQLLGGPPLQPDELTALTSTARLRTLAAGQRVFSQRQPARALVLVQEGDAALGFTLGDGSFRIERRVRGPAWLDQSAAWLDAEHGSDACALTPLRVLELPRDDLQAVLARHPALAPRLITGLAREVQSLTANTHGLMHKDAPARFAEWLLRRCQMVERGLERSAGRGAERAVVSLGERKRDIASQLAITPETLSRLLRSLTRSGLIAVSGYTVHVADMDGLRRLAEGQGA